jgi:hypothetical protein
VSCISLPLGCVRDKKVTQARSGVCILYNVGMPEAADRDRLRVVLVRTRNPLNIGAVARVMSNFGFLNLRLVQPFEASFREARSAVGAVELLENAQVFDSVAEAIGDCSMVVGASAIRDREIHQPVETLPRVGEIVRGALARERVACLVQRRQGYRPKTSITATSCCEFLQEKNTYLSISRKLRLSRCTRSRESMLLVGPGTAAS